MKDLFIVLQKFLMRDLSYVIGGGTVIISFLFAFDCMPKKDPPTYLLLLVIGIAYAIGYSIQDGFSLCCLVRTKADRQPTRFGKYLYKRFEGSELKCEDVNAAKYREAKKWLYSDPKFERLQADYERIESLKQVGTTLGPCFIVSAIPLLVSAIALLCAEPPSSKFELTTAIGMLFLGITLVALGWLKVTQQAQYLLMNYEDCSKEDSKGE